MKNTYYTPELEEFCLGFECEYYNRETEVWEKLTIDTIKLQLNECNYYLFYDKEGNKRDNYTFLSEAPKFRVKYLDSEDIKELGFKVLVVNDIVLDTSTETWYEKVDSKNPDFRYTIIHRPTVNKVTIRHYFGNPKDVLTLFDGTICNKSELKTLLKQIGTI